MVDVFQRRDWEGKPYPLGDIFRLHKDISGRSVDAICRLVPHPLGWELRLEMAGALQRSQVCRSQEEIFDTSDQWKAALLEKGWAPLG